MNGIFNSGVEWWQATIMFVVAVLGVVTIRISLNFDLNKWQERQETNRKNKLMNICPHFEMILVDKETHDGNNVEVRSLFIKPPMTMKHKCKRCGLATYLNLEEHERQADYYLNNPDEYNNAVDKFHKLLKKMGRA